MSEYISKESIVTLLEQYGYIDKEMERDLASIPSADVRPNIHGHWIRHLRNDLGVKLNDCIECSECKTWFTTEELLRRSFCPNCGADMRGKTE